MVIKEGEPWILWPNLISFGINTGDICQTLEGDTDFTLSIYFRVISQSNKRTIFAKLPNYCGVDIQQDNSVLLILKLKKNNEDTHKYINTDYFINEEFNLLTYRFNKTNNIVEVLINEKIIISYQLESDEILSKVDDPHIIFGSGNFPQNNFNLNYCSYESNFLLIAKSYKTYEDIIKIKEEKIIDNTIVGLYDFEKRTEYKLYDLSEHCNFIHKIL